METPLVVPVILKQVIEFASYLAEITLGISEWRRLGEKVKEKEGCEFKSSPHPSLAVS